MRPDRAKVLRWISKYYAPETCAAIDFEMLIDYVGDRGLAERLLKDFWVDGLVVPLSSETKPTGGITQGVAPTLDQPIRPSNRFVVSPKGIESIEALFDPQSDDDPLNTEWLHDDPQVRTEIIRVSGFVNEWLLRDLERNPGRMLSLTPRQFEELVAELFAREGFEVELTPASGDGGRDVIAVHHSELGTHRYLAECKRYGPANKVGVEFVRSLYGVAEAERATYAVLATTSSFTKGALEFAREVRWRLGLKDYEALREWLNKVGRRGA